GDDHGVGTHTGAVPAAVAAEQQDVDPRAAGPRVLALLGLARLLVVVVEDAADHVAADVGLPGGVDRWRGDRQAEDADDHGREHPVQRAGGAGLADVVRGHDDGGPADGQQQRGDDYAGEDVGVDGQRQQLGTVDHGGDEDTDAHEQQESEQDRDARLASSGPDMTDAGEERRDR